MSDGEFVAIWVCLAMLCFIASKANSRIEEIKELLDNRLPKPHEEENSKAVLANVDNAKRELDRRILR